MEKKKDEEGEGYKSGEISFEKKRFNCCEKVSNTLRVFKVALIMVSITTKGKSPSLLPKAARKNLEP